MSYIKIKAISNEQYLIRLKEVAELNGGNLLSTNWTGSKEKYQFMFQDGRIFFMRASSLHKYGWPKDPDLYFNILEGKFQSAEDRLKWLKTIAELNGGKLVSTEWIGPKEKYRFEFSNGQPFEIKENNLRSQGWPKDQNYYFNMVNSKKKTHSDFLSELKDIAELNGGELISKKWLGNNKSHEFKTKDGNYFKATYTRFKSIGWPKDLKQLQKNQMRSLKNKEDYYNNLKRIVETKGGKIITEEWLGYQNLHDFIDIDGNAFNLTPEQVINGQWTPDRGLVSEPICRQVLEHFFKDKFVKTRKVLTKELLTRNSALELDGYCEKLNLAFEYQGYPSHWDENHKHYIKTKEREILKKEYCEKLGITLIIIEKFQKNKTKWEKEYVVNHVLLAVETAFKLNKKTLPHLNVDDFNIDFKQINHKQNMLGVMQEKAKLNKGTLLSKEWNGYEAFYLFKDQFEQEFSASYQYIKSNWPESVEEYKKRQEVRNKTNEENLYELKKIAELNGGKLLSTEWQGSHYEYEFKDKDNLCFKVKASYLKENGWINDINLFMRKSIGQKKTPQERVLEMQSFARENDGECLSKEWLGSPFYHVFKDKSGIVFKGKFLTLMKDGWPKDIHKYIKEQEIRQRTNEDMLNNLKQLAEVNGGKLISTEWNGSLYKYEFETKDGHRVFSIPRKVQQNGFPEQKNLLNELKQLAEVNGGKLISTEWNGSLAKYEFVSANKEKFQANYQYINKYGWPNDIEGFLKNSKAHLKSSKDFLKEIQEIAYFNNGKLLSTIYVSAKDKLLFMSNDGQTFEMCANKLKTRGWPKNITQYNCKTPEDYLKEISCIAKDNNAKLLSTMYISAREKLLFESDSGIQFQMSANALKTAGWPSDINHLSRFQKKKKFL